MVLLAPEAASRPFSPSFGFRAGLAALLLGQPQVAPLFCEGAHHPTLALSSTTTAFLPGDCGAHFWDRAPFRPRLLPQSSPRPGAPLAWPTCPAATCSPRPPPPVSPALCSPLDPNVSELGTSEPSTLGLGPRPVLPVPFQLSSSGSQVSPQVSPTRPPPQPAGSGAHPSPVSPVLWPQPASLQPLTPVWSQSPRGLPQFLTCTPLRFSPPSLRHL